MAHFAIAATWGPTDPTRAMLPFIFAASALQDGDTVSLMLFHDAVHMATKGLPDEVVPFGPPQRYEVVASHPNAEIWVCKPCAVSRHITSEIMDSRVTVAGMNEFHAAAKREDAKVVTF